MERILLVEDCGHVGMSDFDQKAHAACDPHLLVPKPPDIRNLRQWMLDRAPE